MLTSITLALTLLAATAGPALVVVNKGESTVSVIDLTAGTILATLPTGHGPHEVAASGDGRWAAVTDYGSQQAGSSLTIVDLKALAVARTISLLPHLRPHGAAFLPDHRTVAVTSETSGVVLLVDAETGEIIRTLPTGQKGSHMVAVTRDGQVGYTANIGSGSLSRLDLSGRDSARILPVSIQTEAIGLTPNGGQTWLGSNPTGKVYAVDIAGWKVIDSLQTSGMPYRIGFTPDGISAVVTNPMANEVRVFDAATRAHRATIPLDPGDQPLGLIFSPDNATAWVTLGGSAQVAELDLSTHTVRRHLPTGGGPDGIAYVVR
jgi:DNA-binding beta-propeller fold protein YncE